MLSNQDERHRTCRTRMNYGSTSPDYLIYIPILGVAMLSMLKGHVDCVDHVICPSHKTHCLMRFTIKTQALVPESRLYMLILESFVSGVPVNTVTWKTLVCFPLRVSDDETQAS